jgi:hypothetical protein
MTKPSRANSSSCPSPGIASSSLVGRPLTLATNGPTEIDILEREGAGRATGRRRNAGENGLGERSAAPEAEAVPTGAESRY